MKTLVFYLLLVYLYTTLASKPYRSDGRCGPGFPAPDGTPEAICDQYGVAPCCSEYGWCGWQDAYCKCDGCKDFRDFREDKRCGAGYSAPSGKTEAICNKYSEGPCCSEYGWCGWQDEYCKCTGCKDFRDWREDFKCGGNNMAPNGEVATCNPFGPSPCCSPYGWCGWQDEYCKCEDCVDYKKWRDDGRCGSDFMAPNGDVAICDPKGIAPCCSQYNWCGWQDAYCACDGCIDYKTLTSDK